MHLTWNALARLEEYRETLGQKLFIPLAKAVADPFMVDVQYIVALRLFP